jgi:hypothetical protein
MKRIFNHRPRTRKQQLKGCFPDSWSLAPGTCFIEVNKEEIRKTYPAYYHEQARYFKAKKKGQTLCFYGIIHRTKVSCEAFLMMGTFQGRVLSKGFFLALFHHLFSLGYREIWTWTKWDRLIRLLARFEKLGIQEAECPPWDIEAKVAPLPRVGSLSQVDRCQTKTWFIKRID